MILVVGAKRTVPTNHNKSPSETIMQIIRGTTSNVQQTARRSKYPLATGGREGSIYLHLGGTRCILVKIEECPTPTSCLVFDAQCTLCSDNSDCDGWANDKTSCLVLDAQYTCTLCSDNSDCDGWANDKTSCLVLDAQYTLYTLLRQFALRWLDHGHIFLL